MKKIGAFITPHGFGHATRAIGVLHALQARVPDLHIEIFTTVPEHLFSQSLNSFTCHPVLCDIGLVQKDAMNCDFEATAARLHSFLPFKEELLDTLCGQLRGCECVLCDISVLGISAAEHAGIPSVLVENFTWDWIYDNSPKTAKPLTEYARKLSGIYRQASFRVQAEPVCHPLPHADLNCPPIFRPMQQAAQDVRNSLGAGSRRLILLSMGGVSYSLYKKELFEIFPDCYFVIAGQHTTEKVLENCTTLSYDSVFYHPDLIGAADLVICKSGYSTVAECLQTGTRIGCIERDSFPESGVLSKFVTDRLNGTLLSEEIYSLSVWRSLLPEMLEKKKPERAETNGANLVADFILGT